MTKKNIIQNECHNNNFMQNIPFLFVSYFFDICMFFDVVDRNTKKHACT